MKNNKSYTVDEVLLLMESYCAYQERCHAEVTQKLYEYGMITDAQEKIIIHLLSNNFLNEERFAKSFVRGKFNIKHWGRNKIKAALHQRNISEYNVKSGLNEIEEDDYLQLLSVEMDKKSNLINDSNPWKRKKKITNYLLQKGFEYPLIEMIWNEKQKDKN